MSVATKLVALSLLLVSYLDGAVASISKYQDVMRKLGCSDDEMEQVAQGKLLKKTLESSHERELAVVFAILVKSSPEQIRDKYFSMKYKQKYDKQVTKVGFLSNDNVFQSDFDGLTLETNGEAMAKELADAVPGSDLNLSKEEMASFNALQDNDGNSALLQKAETKLREMLFARVKSYQEKGLNGILPYARTKGKNYKPGEDLLTTLEMSKVTKGEAPSFYQALANYPRDRPEGLDEKFSWIDFNIEATGPTVSLSHRLGMMENGVYVFAERIFYNLKGYNSVQGIGGAFPCDEGTFVVYSSKTSTDQVAGFGGAAKRAIGARVMGNILAQLLERYREHEHEELWVALEFYWLMVRHSLQCLPWDEVHF